MISAGSSLILILSSYPFYLKVFFIDIVFRTPPTGETNLPSLGAMITKLELANPSVLAEGLSLGEGSLRDVLQLINPLTGRVANLTCALEGNCD